MTQSSSEKVAKFTNLTQKLVSTVFDIEEDLTSLFSDIYTIDYQTDDEIDENPLRPYEFYKKYVPQQIAEIRNILKKARMYDNGIESYLIRLRELFLAEVKLVIDDRAGRLTKKVVEARIKEIIELKNADMAICIAVVARFKSNLPHNLKDQLETAILHFCHSVELHSEKNDKERDQNSGAYNTFLFIEKYGIPKDFIVGIFNDYRKEIQKTIVDMERNGDSVTASNLQLILGVFAANLVSAFS